MKRLEIIANQSVQEDIVSTLESRVAEFQYSLLPVVHGRGPSDWKLGTTVWPEANFLLFCYLEDDKAEQVKALMAEIKVAYPKEGIKVYTLTVD